MENNKHKSQLVLQQCTCHSRYLEIFTLLFGTGDFPLVLHCSLTSLEILFQFNQILDGERGRGGGTYAYWHKNRHHFRLSLALLYNWKIIFKAACLNYESYSELKWIICEVRHVKSWQEEKDWKFGHKISVHMLVLVNMCLHFSLMGWVMDIWSQSFLIG